MTAPNGRFDRRITKEVAVELARPDASQLREMANCPKREHSRDAVATEHVWLPGDPVLLSSPESGVLPGHVSLLQRVENNRFAVGLELLAPLGEWTKASLARCWKHSRSM